MRAGALFACCLAVSGCTGAEVSGADGGRTADAATVATDGARPDVGPGHDGGTTSGDDAATTPSDAASPTGTPVFVAIGKFARITTSMDDGASWPFNRSDDDTASCVGIDCDHHPGSATGITFGAGDVYASFGWGDNPTRLYRSHDGVTWGDPVYDVRDFSFAGIAWAGDRLVVGDATPRYSTDRGVTYSTAAWPDYHIPDGAWPNARGVGYADVMGGRIALLTAVGDGSWADTTISRDQGLTYQHPTALPAECRGFTRGLEIGGGLWLEAWSGTNVVCRSTDGGDHWELATIPASGEITRPMWTGHSFVLFAGNEGFESTDGASWTSFTNDANIAVAAYSPVTGTFVGTGGWGAWYDRQRLYRSTDGGHHWTELPESAFLRSHPITAIAFGYVGGS